MFKKSNIVLFLILFIGILLRLYGNNWDQGWHLHPDERFLTMVGVDVKIPASISQYLDQRSSPFNPVNKGHAFYVYGTFPILLNKVLAGYLNNDTYDLFNLQGRVLSGVTDFLILLIIYKLVELIEKKVKFSRSVKYFAAFFYAVAVLPIQLSHFFTVDTFLNLFCWLSLYFAVRLVVSSHTVSHVVRDTCFSGFFFGLALACKVNAVYMVPLIGIFVLIGIKAVIPVKTGEVLACGEIQSIKFNFKRDIVGWIPACAGMTSFVIFCYIALRFGSPYYFETNNLFNPQLSTVFVNNIKTLKSFDDPQALYPPAVQWLSKSYNFSLKNIIFFGVGPVYFLLSFMGIFLLCRKKNWYIILSILWAALLLVYQSFQFAQTMRYLIFLYPFLAIAAAVGTVFMFNKTKKMSKRFKYPFFVICMVSVVVWPLAFMSIYTKPHSRVTASRWIYTHVPSGSIILTEYWDDPLPLTVQDPQSRNYIGEEVHIFDADTKEKWNIINQQLASADYYVMSSNRGWGSITEVPDRYPISSQFYKNMMQNKEGYTLVKTFTSYPSLRYFGIPIDFPDQWAEEAFTVYDHPEVMIFKKN